jgi:hypothetical protein
MRELAPIIMNKRLFCSSELPNLTFRNPLYSGQSTAALPTSASCPFRWFNRNQRLWPFCDVRLTANKHPILRNLVFASLRSTREVGAEIDHKHDCHHSDRVGLNILVRQCVWQRARWIDCLLVHRLPQLRHRLDDVADEVGLHQQVQGLAHVIWPRIPKRTNQAHDYCLVFRDMRARQRAKSKILQSMAVEQGHHPQEWL